jgi:hypothetical protein
MTKRMNMEQSQTHERRVTALSPWNVAAINVQSWWWQLAVFGIYMLLGIAFTWPLAAHMQTEVIQKGSVPVDSGQNIWNIWWVQHALLNGHNPYFTNYLFYPEHVNLFWQTLGLPNALLMLPVSLAWGPVAAFNLLVLLSFGLGGYFMYRIAYNVTADAWAALVAGFVFAFSAHHMQPLLGGALEIVSIQWVPLYILLLMRAFQKPSLLRCVATALALTAATLVSSYFGLFGAIYTLFHGAIVFFKARGRRRWTLLGAGAAIGALWAISLLPFIWPLDSLGGVAIADWHTRQVFHSAAVVDLLSGNVLHPLWGSYVRQRAEQLHPFGIEIGASAGIVAYALIGYGAARNWRQTWPWLVLAGAMFVFALGPELKITQAQTGIPLPFAALDLFGPFRNSSRPSRFITLMMVPVSVMVSIGFHALRALPRRDLVCSAVAALLVFEYLVQPWPMLALHVEPLYARLAQDAMPGAMLELPPKNDSSQYLLNQIEHGRPLMGGYLARTPAYPLIGFATATRRLWFAQSPQPDIFQASAVAELGALGVRYVVLHLDELSHHGAANIRKQLATGGATLLSQETNLEVYQVPSRMAAALLPQAGWYDMETDGQRRWRWMSQQAQLILASNADAVVAMSLSATAYQENRPLHVLLDGMPVGAWTIPAAPGSQTIVLHLFVTAGQHTLSLASTVTPVDSSRALSLSFTEVVLRDVQPALPRR